MALTRKLFSVAALMLGALMASGPTLACSRAVYLGPDGQIITGRTMDWMEGMHTNLYVFPRGMEREASAKSGFRWTSRYGSVAASVYEGGTADGMNEKGLAANLLFLAGTEYPPSDGDKRPVMPISAWTQYVLDSFATVAEVVKAHREEKFRVEMVVAPNGSNGVVHLSVSDASGDSAILEFIGGKLAIHHGREFQVMTNEPKYDDQLALNAYWKRIGGIFSLPGTNKAEDRFVRASYYINAVQQTSQQRDSVAAVFSVMRNVSVPRGITTPDRPNIAQTIWLTVADHRNKVYYFQDTYSPGIVWLRVADIDFSSQAGVRRVTLDGKPDVAGDQTQGLAPAKAFTFLTTQ